MMNSSIYSEAEGMTKLELKMHILGHELPYQVKEVYLDELLSRANDEFLQFHDVVEKKPGFNRFTPL